MPNLYENTIQIIAKAHKFTFGETLIEYIKIPKKVSLVLIASDASSNTIKKIKDKCHYYNVHYIVCLNKTILASLVNKDISALGVLDINLAKKLLINLQKGGIDYEEYLPSN